MRPAVLLALSSITLIPAAFARAAEGPAPAAVQLFETRIRPMLIEHCHGCHGPVKQRGDLRLDSGAALLRGGYSGPAVDRQRPERSLLLRAVSHTDPNLSMPPKKKLPDRLIADLKTWVQMGAPYPASAGAAPTRTVGWAFQPLADPAPPAVKDPAWAQGSLDRFILAGLESQGLRPAPPANRRALLLRVTFDLIGLPPNPEEMDAFLADTSADAFARVVDRLLASPHYGERWGRHWLDVARYADSNGLDENVAHGNAWRYRDYVVASFNRDKPYDRFVLEQLAGDLLPVSDPAARQEQLIATGFLSLGPKVLAEVDETKMEMDIIDEQIDTVGRAFLGLTLGCARCHDHKFDPIQTDDYYALAGVFKSTRTMEHFKKIARWYEHPLDPDQPPVEKEKGKAGSDVPGIMGVTERAVVDVPIHIRGNHLTLGRTMPRGVPHVLAGSHPPAFDGKQSGRLHLAHWLIQPDHPLTARVLVNRVWRWHMGQGLVRSTDNFGNLGEPPANPALLDWLARRFVADGWSLKSLHRLILLSSTYQMSSRYDATAARRDPDNRLCWRQNIRRLEAEEIRDALLAVGNQLDPAMTGPVLHVKNRAFLFDHTSKDTTRYDSTRRSLYLPVIRNNLYDVFQLFDSTDAAVPSSDRATTTVAPQALFMLNSDLVNQVCRRLAGRLLQEPDDSARLRLLYRRAYGREPTEAESARNRSLLARLEEQLEARMPDASQRRLQVWAWLCQTVLAANEFIYLV
jgi:hypothetical protein